MLNNREIRPRNIGKTSFNDKTKTIKFYIDSFYQDIEHQDFSYTEFKFFITSDDYFHHNRAKKNTFLLTSGVTNSTLLIMDNCLHPDCIGILSKWHHAC